tara:strand:- start:16 stop:189 length:174 start_codon:yes stop_codon:yes gene_type:complete
MNIKSAKYYKNNGINVSVNIIIDEDELLAVPMDPANRHYQEVLEWAEKDGNEIQAAE